MHSLLRKLITTSIQLALGFILVFPGWDLLYNIVKPTSNNWMWIEEMKWSFIALSILIVISNVVSKDNRKLRNIFLAIQFLFVLAFVALRYGVFPHRSLFVLATYTIVIISIVPINALIKRSRKLS